MNFLILALALAAQDSEEYAFHAAGGLTAASLPAIELADPGVLVGGLDEHAGWPELLQAAGWTRGGTLGKIAFVFGTDAASLRRGAADAKAGLVVLAIDLPRDRAAEILRELGGAWVAVASGRGSGDPEPLKIGESWLVEAPWGGSLWGRYVVRKKGGAVTSVTGGFLAPAGKPSERVAAVKKKHGLPVDPEKDLAALSKGGALRDDGPRAIEGRNRACRVRVHDHAIRESYGARKGRFLVLDVELENIIPMTLVDQLEVPTQYRMGKVGDHVYLVVDGFRVSRILPNAGSLAGHLPVEGLSLDRLGSKKRGNLVFEIPAKTTRLELKFYDYAHGHVVLPPFQDGKVDEPKPARENEVLAASVRAERKGTRVRVEFRAKSRFAFETDASAFDPKAEKGAKLEVGTVCDWTEARKHTHLILDGEYAYAPVAWEFEEAPRFLPDAMTGGTIEFVVPEKFTSMELRCDFPNAATPQGEVIHPEPLVFAIEGERPDLPDREAIAEIDDDCFLVQVVGQSFAKEFAGAKAGNGRKFVILDVTVKNQGDGGEWFQTVEQLKVGGAAHAATWKGPRAPQKLVWLPKGERRTFQIAFEIKDSEKAPKLSYAGVSKAEIVELKSDDAAPEKKPRVCPKCKEKAADDDAFCQSCGAKIPD